MAKKIHSGGQWREGDCKGHKIELRVSFNKESTTPQCQDGGVDWWERDWGIQGDLLADIASIFHIEVEPRHPCCCGFPPSEPRVPCNIDSALDHNRWVVDTLAAEGVPTQWQDVGLVKDLVAHITRQLADDGLPI